MGMPKEPRHPKGWSKSSVTSLAKTNVVSIAPVVRQLRQMVMNSPEHIRLFEIFHIKCLPTIPRYHISDLARCSAVGRYRTCN